jgi:hypothetical protein
MAFYGASHKEGVKKASGYRLERIPGTLLRLVNSPAGALGHGGKSSSRHTPSAPAVDKGI